jgi:DNA-binding transcriptional MocR family regulator
MAYRTSIVDGSLRPGQRIPSTRVLASELGVSRFPVLNAYAQLLAEGYFESRVGAGTVRLQFHSGAAHVERAHRTTIHLRPFRTSTLCASLFDPYSL